MAMPSNMIPDKIRAFIDQLVWCKDEYKDLLTMGLAVSHVKNSFTTVPYILATGDKPGSGKSTIAFDIPMLLADNVESIDRTTTRDALNNMFLSRETPNTAWDDVGKIFGANGTNGSTTNFYTVLVRSYRKNATTKMSRNGATVSMSTYGMAFLNGLKNAVPNDLFTRCVWFKMEEAPDGAASLLRDTQDESVEQDAKLLKAALHSWATSHSEDMKQFMKGKVRHVHPKLTKRRRQLYGPLFAAADAAGGEWPRKIFDAFVAVALDAGEKPQLTPDQQLLMDAASILMRTEARTIFTGDLIEALQEMPDGDYYRNVEQEHLVDRLFPEAFGPSKRVNGVKLYGEHKGAHGAAKGYTAVSILRRAQELRDMLYPPMEQDCTDPVEAELEFQPSEKVSA
jgi:hypothetical protein